MRKEPLIILKFGGSVLVSPDRMRLAVHEIYRWRRDGFRVVAVVSALAGKTDELISVCQTCSPDASPNATASALALGETESAALLGVQLDRIGMPHRVLTPASVGLIGVGDPLDANPLEINSSILREALDDEGVVVFPGFIAVDRLARHVTLGRGGSDLTAIFLAHELRADKCRLIKDVDGLYTADPARAPTRPARYSECSYTDALMTDGSIIQHKATRFAQERDVEFEIGRFGGTAPTHVGHGASVTTESRDLPRKLRVALAGAGTVGGGVLELVSQLPEYFEVTAVCCRSDATRQEFIDRGYRVERDTQALVNDSDVVVELIGGTEKAGKIVHEALNAGCHVVTANKALLAESGVLFDALANDKKCTLLASASVGGGIPILERVSAAGILSICGVLNGTSNFILERTRLGESFKAALAEAQQIGLAEADPSRDLDGTDSLDKLRVLAQIAGISVNQSLVDQEALTPESVRSASDIGRLRHVASLSNDGLGIKVEQVMPDDMLFDLPGEMNAVRVEFDDGTTQVLRGKGAGRWPTAESVMADLLQISRIESQKRVAEHV